MKILITGISGYVGAIVARHLGRIHNVMGVDVTGIVGANRFDCDLSDLSAVERLACESTPDIVIHAAGNKNIEFCEKNPDEAFRINCEAVKNVAQVFGDRSRIIYLSTDYVFDGIRGNYSEIDSPAPMTVYGRSKHCGEEEGRRYAGSRFLILRMSALYSIQAAFPKFLLEHLSHGENIDCFSDVRYSPTYYRDFLSVLDKLLLIPVLSEHVFHICGEPTTRYEFARNFASIFGFDVSQIKEAFAADRKTFLFPDLSLRNDWMREILQNKPTPIIDALTEIKNTSWS